MNNTAKLPPIPKPYSVKFEIKNNQVLISLDDFYSYLERLELTYYRISETNIHEDLDRQIDHQNRWVAAAKTIEYLGKKLETVFTEENIKKFSKHE